MKKRFLRTTAAGLALLMTVGSLDISAFAASAGTPDTGTTATEMVKETTTTVTEPADYGPVPNQQQLDYYEQELAAFMHFGPNTYTNLEWGNDTYTVDNFQCTEFHADDMVTVLQNAGFKRLIITAKHHDGFCLWNSAYTDFDVDSSSYDGDILAELSAACTKYDMDMGLYLSPWDIHEPSYGYGSGGSASNDKNGDYNQYYINQIKEICDNDAYGNNGEFIEWWMDGAKGSGEDAQDYRMQSFVDTIRNGNEGVQIFGATEYGGGVHWIGNERGIAGDNEWHQKKITATGESYWSVPECDVSLTPGWFYHDGQSPKTMEQLATIYFSSVGRGCPLLLNVAPNKQGTYTPAVITRLQEFSTAITETFDEDLTEKEGVTAQASAVRGNADQFSADQAIDKDADAQDTYWTMEDGQTTGSLTIDLGATQAFDVVSIEEYIEKGQRIQNFTVEYRNGDSADWKLFGSGSTIAAKRLVRGSTVKADQIRINITGSKAVPLINNVGVYKAAKDFALGAAYPDTLKLIDDREFTTTGTWTQETIDGINTTGIWSRGAGATASFTFTGTKAWIMGTMDPNHGAMTITIDGAAAGTANTYATSRSLKKLLYTTPDLAYGTHTVTMTSTTSAALGLDVAYYNSNPAGMFEIENSSYAVDEAGSFDVKIKRMAGSTGEATVKVLTPPGTAVQGQYYYDIDRTLTFAEGETEKTITVTTIDNDAITGDLEFYIEIQNPANADLGFLTTAEVVINDNDGTEELQAAVTAVEGYKESSYMAAGWPAFADALATAKAILAAPQNFTQTAVNNAKAALIAAKDALVARTGFTAEDPFIMPADTAAGKDVEAELFTLVPRVAGAVPDSINKNVRVAIDSAASGGSKISWFENENAIRLPFFAAKAGKYTVTMRYQSGRSGTNLNTMNWSGTNVAAGSYAVPANGNPNEQLTTAFDITVTAAGAGELVFTADSHCSPNIDKLTFIGKELVTANHNVTAEAVANGTITPGGITSLEAGRSQVFTIIPDEGYVVDDVVVDGVSVGAVTSYTIENIEKDTTISVTFRAKTEAEISAEKITGFVTRLYEKVLGRTAAAEEIGYYTDSLTDRTKNGAGVGKGFVFSPEFADRGLSNEDYVEVLYETFMGRASDAEGKAYWINFLNNGISRMYVFKGFVESEEYTGICSDSGIDRGNVEVEESRDMRPQLTMYVYRLYEKALGREAETDGLNYYTKEIMAGNVTSVRAAQNFFSSEEFQDKKLSDEDYVKVLYRTFMGREFEQEGLAYHTDRLAAGTAREDILLGFANSPEFAGIMESFGVK